MPLVTLLDMEARYHKAGIGSPQSENRAAHKGKIGPKIGNQKTVIFLMIFTNLLSKWVGNSPFKNLSYQNLILVKIDVFGVKKKVQKGTTRSSGPKTDFF